jgi:Tfp pilus assembly protein PilF
VVILALTVRGAFQLERAFDPGRYDFPAGMDEYNYDRLAAATAAGRSFFPGVIHSLPGYPALLAVLYRAGGRSPDLVRGVQVLLGALSCGLTFLVGRKILGTGGGLLAGLILAFYGPAVFFEGRLLPAAAALFFSLAALAWWTDPPKADRPLSRAAGGILLGLAALFSPAILFFALFLLLFRLARRRGGAPGFWRRTGPTVLGILAVLTPFGIRNSLRAGGPVLLTAHSGINFFLGNNPEAEGGFRTPLFLTPSATRIILDSRREANLRTGRELNPAEVSGFWFHEGLRHLAANPGAGARIWGKKLLLLFSPREYLDIGSEAASGPIKLFGIPLLPFGWLLPPALLGFFLLPRGNPARGPLFFFLSGQVLAVLLFFHQGRTRLLIVPVLAVLAAGTVRFLWRTLREGRWKRAAAMVILLAVLAAVTRGGGKAEMRSETNLLLFAAQREIIKGNEGPARALAEKALDLHPGLGGAELVLGAAAEAAGDRAAAERHYRAARGKEPFNPQPDLRLSLLFFEEGETEKAAAAARSALGKDPLSWRGHSLLADAARERGDGEGLYRHLLRAVEFNPNSARDQRNLALYYREEGDRALAGYHERRAERVEKSAVSGHWI